MLCFHPTQKLMQGDRKLFVRSVETTIDGSSGHTTKQVSTHSSFIAFFSHRIFATFSATISIQIHSPKWRTGHSNCRIIFRIRIPNCLSQIPHNIIFVESRKVRKVSIFRHRMHSPEQLRVSVGQPPYPHP